MKRLALLALACLGLATGCGSNCKDLGDRICGCQTTTSAQDTCKTQVSNELKAQNITDAEEAHCEALLKTCTDSPDGTSICSTLQTPEGKVACGLADPVP